MSSLIGRVCAAYRLQTAQELGLGSSGLKTPRYLKIIAAFQQLSHHIGDLVPQPAHRKQSGSSSVEGAMGAGYGATGAACKAPGQATNLVRLQSARRGLPRDRRSSPGCRLGNVSVKGLRFFEYVSKPRKTFLKKQTENLRHRSRREALDGARRAAARNPAVGSTRCPQQPSPHTCWPTSPIGGLRIGT